MLKSQEHTFGARNREMRAIVVAVTRTLRNGLGRFLNDIDFVQGSLFDWSYGQSRTTSNQDDGHD